MGKVSKLDLDRLGWLIPTAQNQVFSPDVALSKLLAAKSLQIPSHAMPFAIVDFFLRERVDLLKAGLFAD